MIWGPGTQGLGGRKNRVKCGKTKEPTLALRTRCSNDADQLVMVVSMFRSRRAGPPKKGGVFSNGRTLRQNADIFQKVIFKNFKKIHIFHFFLHFNNISDLKLSKMWNNITFFLLFKALYFMIFFTF